MQAEGERELKWKFDLGGRFKIALPLNDGGLSVFYHSKTSGMGNCSNGFGLKGFINTSGYHPSSVVGITHLV